MRAGTSFYDALASFDSATAHQVTSQHFVFILNDRHAWLPSEHRRAALNWILSLSSLLSMNNRDRYLCQLTVWYAPVVGRGHTAPSHWYWTWPYDQFWMWKECGYEASRGLSHSCVVWPGFLRLLHQEWEKCGLNHPCLFCLNPRTHTNVLHWNPCSSIELIPANPWYETGLVSWSQPRSACLPPSYWPLDTRINAHGQ